MSRLANKIAVITGSSSGIGKALAFRFAEEGAKVVVAARRETLLQEVADQVTARGGEAFVIPTDVANEVQVEDLIQRTVSQFGRLDILVNNAGIGGGRRVAETTTASFDRVMEINLRGTFFCCRAGFRQMKQQGGGTIINMSSVAGVQAWAGTGTYSASKHGIMALTKSLADEGRDYKIKVSALCPAGVADELVDATPEEIEDSQKISPFDVAEAAIFLATLGTHTVIHEIKIDRLGADW